MKRTCERCGGERHTPECPEMFWPDGKPRGAAPDLPLPPFNPNPDFQPASTESPLSQEMAKILAPATQGMIERYVRSERRRHLEKAS